VVKRLVLPSMLLGLILTLASPANAQITCSIASTGGPIAAVPALPGVTRNGSEIGHAEVGAAGINGIPDMPGGGRVRITCTNSSSAAVNSGVVALTVNFGVLITNSQTHPSTAAGIRLINGTGAFATPGPVGPADANPGNVGIAAIENAGGRIIIGLGTPGSTAGSDSVSPTVPSSGITFPSGTSTFELAGWLLSTSGKSGAINATLTSTPGIGVVPGATCSASGGACTPVISSVQPSVQDPTIPTGALPALVTSLPNLGTTAIAGGPAVVNSSGVVAKSNFTIRVRENYPDFFKSSGQFNAGAVFPMSASSVQVSVAFNNIPAGLDISGCAAVLTDLSGATPAFSGGPTVSTPSVTANSRVLTVFFSTPVDQDEVDILWLTCTKVGPGTATLPLPSTPVTAQVFLSPAGEALSSSGSPFTGLTTGVVPRYASPQGTTNSFALVSFGGTTSPIPSTPAAAITASAGTPQTAEVGAAFSALRVTVRDRFENPVSGATVTFASDTASNAGAIFPRGNTAVTDASGQATIEIRANFSIGTYVVAATSGTATHATFTLTNTPRLTVAVPALLSGNANQLGIAWTNTSARPINVRATARGYDGQLITGSGVQNPADITVPAGGQFARLGTEVFGAGIAGRSGWIELTASEAGANGFFLIFDSTLTTSDGGSFPVAPSRQLVFPRVDRDTVLHIVNTGDSANPATGVFVYDNNGVLAGSTTVSLGAKAGWSGRIADLLPAVQAIDGYVVVNTQGEPFSSSSETLVGMQSFQRGDSSIVIGQRDSELVRSGYAVHVAIGDGFTTRLTLANPASVQQQLQLTLNGVTVQRTIPALGRLDESLGQMFNISGSGLTTGYLKVQTSTTGVSGYVEITASNGLVRTTTPISDKPERRLMFSHIAQGGGFFTGLALLNTEAAPAIVTIEVNSPSGAALATRAVTLQPGERLINLLSELFPNIQNQMGGFVRVVSTLPIHGLQIFGNLDSRLGNFLTNIPAGVF
jgi:hypothetical protein